MKQKVRLLTRSHIAHRLYEPGEVVEVDAIQARWLIEAGAAEPATDARVEPKPKPPETAAIEPAEETATVPKSRKRRIPRS